MVWMALPGCKESQVLSSSPSSSWLAALTGGTDPALHCAHSPHSCSPAAVGGALQSLRCATFWSSWPAGFSEHKLHFESNFFVVRAAAHVWGHCSAISLFPSLKNSLCGTHITAPSLCSALCALHFSKRQKVFLGQGWPHTCDASVSLRSQNFSFGLSQLVL